MVFANFLCVCVCLFFQSDASKQHNDINTVYSNSVPTINLLMMLCLPMMLVHREIMYKDRVSALSQLFLTQVINYPVDFIKKE